MVFPQSPLDPQLISAPLSGWAQEPLPSERQVAGEDVEVQADSAELCNHPHPTVGI